MDIKVASLMSKMGFDIDTSDLNKLDAHLRDIRGSTALLARNLRAVNGQLNTTSTRMKTLATSAEAVKSLGNIGSKYVNLATNITQSENALEKFANVLLIVEPRLTSIQAKVTTAAEQWERLAKAVKETNGATGQTSTKTPKAPRGVGGGVGTTSGHSIVPNKTGGMSGGVVGGAMAALSRFTPAGMLIGGGATVGVVGREIITRGRAQTAMEQAMLFASDSTTEYAKSLEFVKNEALRTGNRSKDLGKVYGTVASTTKGVLNETKRNDMFSNFSTFFTSVHAGEYEKGLMWLAIQQMFSTGKIEGQEVGQLTGAGLINRAQYYDAVRAAYGKNLTGKEIASMQKAGELKPEDVLPALAKLLGDKAVKTGSFEKAKESSQFKQGVFQEKLDRASKDLMDSGLDEFISLVLDGLIKVMPYILGFTKGVIGAAKGVSMLVGAIINFIAENAAVIGVLGTVILFMKTLQVVTAGSALQFLRFGLAGAKGIEMVVKAFSKFKLLLLLTALFETMSAFNDAQDGKKNWLTAIADGLIIIAVNAQKALLSVKEFGLEQDLQDLKRKPTFKESNSNGPKVGEVVIPAFGAPVLFGQNNNIPERSSDMLGIPSRSSNMSNQEFNARGEVTVNIEQNGQPTKQVVVPLSFDLGGLGRSGGILT